MNVIPLKANAGARVASPGVERGLPGVTVTTTRTPFELTRRVLEWLDALHEMEKANQALLRARAQLSEKEFWNL